MSFEKRFPNLTPAESWRPLLDDERRAQADDGPITVESMESAIDKPIALGRDEEHFLALSDKRVYFPIRWQGNPFVSFVPRNPQPTGELPIDLS